MLRNLLKRLLGKKLTGILRTQLQNLKGENNKTAAFPQKKPANSTLDDRIFTPIIIFQPGKVGSLSVHHSLMLAFEQLQVGTPIYHSHALNKLDEREAFVRKTRKNPAESLKLIEEWKELRQTIDADPTQKWNIISLVREPVAMKVSALFHLLDQHIPDWQQRHENGKLPMSEIEELFYSKSEFGFNGLDTWYNIQLKALWGIDIFATDFPKEKGYEIYKTDQISLLIIRLEDLNQVAPNAFDDFMGLKEFSLSNVNVGDEKSYADLYKEFKTLALPENYVKEGYATHYARHFYTDAELEKFRKRWLRLA